MNKTPPPPDNHLEDGDNQLEESSSKFVEKSIRSVDANDLKDYKDLLSRVDSHEAKFGAEIKNLGNELKDLRKELERREWLKPSTIVSIGLTGISIGVAIIILLLGAFYHLNVRIDGVGRRIDTIYQSHPPRPPETKAVPEPGEEASKFPGE
ncbi:hypothetical protein [Candidatus Synechococcus spongiarum]|uniref:hypothetical protein n=1 Tax=Candidatus Synechococcus spongiarum TaxID=431041 RepID=UPI0012694411|nr:hypothetical protein [Candidatus Synechococcus spongiarum]